MIGINRSLIIENIGILEMEKNKNNEKTVSNNLHGVVRLIQIRMWDAVLHFAFSNNNNIKNRLIIQNDRDFTLPNCFDLVKTPLFYFKYNQIGAKYLKCMLKRESA